MVVNHFGDDEVEKLLGERGVKLGRFGERSQVRDLHALALGVARGHVVCGLEATNLLRELEALGKQVNECRVNVVDAQPKAREVSLCVSHSQRLQGNATLELSPHRWPFVDENRIHGRVSPAAIGTQTIASHDALELRSELGDRSPRAIVQLVGLQLHAPEPVVECVTEQQQLCFGVDRRAPDLRVICGPADVRVLRREVEVAERARANELSVELPHAINKVAIKCEVLRRPADERVDGRVVARGPTTPSTRIDAGVVECLEKLRQLRLLQRNQLDVAPRQRDGRRLHSGHPSILPVTRRAAESQSPPAGCRYGCRMSIPESSPWSWGWIRRPVWRILGSFVSWFLFALCMNLLSLGFMAVVTSGGSCATGGPFAIENPCPDGVTEIMTASVFGGLISIVISVLFAQGFGTSLTDLAWPILFGGLGAGFIAAGGSVGYGIGGMFVVMALVPLALALRASAQRVVIGAVDAHGTRFFEGERPRFSPFAIRYLSTEQTVRAQPRHWALSLGVLAVALVLGYRAANAIFVAA